MVFNAGAGDDVFDARGDGLLIGGDGIDTVTYANYVSGSNTGITATLSTSPFFTQWHDAEVLVGSQYKDFLRTYIPNSVLSGGDGNDVFFRLLMERRSMAMVATMFFS